MNETESDIKSVKTIADIFDKQNHSQDKKTASNVFNDSTMENKVRFDIFASWFSNPNFGIGLKLQIKIWMNEAYGKSLKRSDAGDDPELGMSNDETDGSEKECHHAGIFRLCSFTTQIR